MYNTALKTFLHVADCGSFSKAAERLFLSPTAVMKQMNQLEEHLGLRLLKRTNHGIFLTECGDSIYKDAKKIISFSEEALARAREISSRRSKTIRIGTSMLNPCKVFMDVWYPISSQFPQFKIQIIPFEDDHNGILAVMDKIGDKFDFIVGVCDSAQWLSRCRFYKLGTYKKCIAVPMGHRLAGKKLLTLSDLEGETLMMVKEGDSPVNDQIRKELASRCPSLRIQDTEHFYDIEVYNRCAEQGNLLLNVECWKDIHPSLLTIPVDWKYEIPYGLLYPLHPAPEILEFLDVIKTSA